MKAKLRIVIESDRVSAKKIDNPILRKLFKWLFEVQVVDNRFTEHSKSGRVVNTKKTEYDPTAKRSGGRIVKIMPRNLKKVKDGQERTNEVPAVQD